MKQLRVMVFGAHPDDPDFTTGGCAVKYAALGHKVRYVSVTNGNAGHQEMGGARLASVRYKEAQNVAAVAGIEYIVMDNNDGYLETDVKTREKVVREMRLFAPDIIFTHRPYDYHPDHRNTSMLVQDSSYLVAVPNFCQMVPPLRYQPIIMYTMDSFKKPHPFTPDVVVDVSDVFETKMRMVHCHKSQVYDWLRWIDHTEEGVPEGDDARLEWLKAKYREHYGKLSDVLRDKLVAKYGEERGKAAFCAEAFEFCEYGGRMDPDKISEYFPF